MTYQQKVEQSRRERKAFRESGSLCPHCGGDGLVPFGGPGMYWIEHHCGAYSGLKPTLEEALVSGWLPPGGHPEDF